MEPLAPWFGVRQRQVAAVQEAVPVSAPAAHEYEPDKMYPALHDGVHEAPLARLPPVHVPRPPFVGAFVAETAQKFGVHAKSVPESAPAVQLYEAEPDCVYPVLHVGVHVAPLARLAVHVPRAPFGGAVTTHGFGLHAAVMVVSVPAEHALVPTSVDPLLHVGVHELPLARLAVHVPSAPFVGAADASHAFALQPAAATTH